jgi:hypothetical protein
MKTFTLKQTTKVGKEDCYHYETAGGEKVTFHADPARAWTWFILEGARKTALALIDAVLDTGFDETKMQTVTVA